MATVEYVFPSACERCQCVEGMPFKAETMADGNVGIALRCRLCRYEWELQIAGGKIALGPKPDRRDGRAGNPERRNRRAGRDNAPLEV